MSNTDYVPTNDAEFNIWQAEVLSDVQLYATLWGILAADITALVALQAAWMVAYAKGGNKNNRQSPDVQAKDDARAAYEKALRKFVAKWLASNDKVTDAERTRMGLTVKSGTHTSVAVPTTNPVATIDFGVLGRHSINFVDSDTPTSKAKPDGSLGAEVWCKLGDAIVYSYLGLCTSTPEVVTYDDVDAGKKATYRLRWVNTKGDEGPWSNTVSAMVVG
jgi:hypothetical protein